MLLLDVDPDARGPGQGEGRPDRAATCRRDGPSARTATGPDWSRPGVEPRREDVLEDPIVHL